MRTGEHGKARGFAYLFLLMAVGVLAGTTAWAVQAGAALARQSAEAQLLAVGEQFSAAFDSYEKSTPLGQHTAPRTLEELLRDPRYPQPVRHLRKLFDDPLTGQANWGLVHDPQGYITGIYSLASGKPIKQVGFAPEEAHFQNSETYAAWIFRGLSNMRAKAVPLPQPLPLGQMPAAH